ncbi:MAG: nuclear transport factor 2 family protein [Verrucomicrobiota bacterium]
MGGGKGKKSGARGGGFPWRRLALVSLLGNLILLFVLLWLRPAEKGEEGVLDFVDRYFRTWSEQDMAGYEACFHPQATIYYVSGEGEASGMTLEPFIKSQVMAHENAAERMREYPLESVVDIDGNVARVLTRWNLVKGASEETGTDYFTLLRGKDGWLIVNLVFKKD